MILQALYEYYQRKAQDPDSLIAPRGFEWKEIPFIIVIDKEGCFLHLEDTREGEGKGKRAKQFLVIKSVARSGAKSWEIVNIFWDHYGYVLAHPKEDAEKEKEKEQAQKQQSSFIKTIQSYATRFSSNEQFAAVRKFYEIEGNSAKVFEDVYWRECSKKTGTNLSFRIAGEKHLVAEHPDLYEPVESTLLDAGDLSKNKNRVCLITGENAPIAILHTATPILGGKSGAKLVGFQKKSGYDSYYKEQGLNAPVSQKAEDAYTTALNVLLGKDSHNKYRLGETSVVFWSEKPTLIESTFPFIFEAPSKDDPDANVRAIKSFYDSIYTGKLTEEEAVRFYVLGLAPNAARISVRFWKAGTVKEFSERILQHFEDLSIIRDDRDSKEFFSLFNLLTTIAFQYKIDNIPPNLVSAVMQSILDGTPYPTSMQMQCLCRIKAQQKVSYIRAAILKAYLNRKNRNINYLKERDITMGLDLENINQGYLCGRLFAVLEKIQENAQPGINSTIRDRYYGAASTTPITVFSRLLSLSNHHREKLSYGSKVYYEKMIQEILGGIDSNGMPAHLSLDDQSRFAIGYYHQRKALWTSRINDNETI
ncbi:MAG: type I-C CRISPR-associated protein Cas8c/Csd1 [Bacteroides sp.]